MSTNWFDRLPWYLKPVVGVGLIALSLSLSVLFSVGPSLVTWFLWEDFALGAIAWGTVLTGFFVVAVVIAFREKS